LRNAQPFTHSTRANPSSLKLGIARTCPANSEPTLKGPRNRNAAHAPSSAPTAAGTSPSATALRHAAIRLFRSAQASATAAASPSVEKNAQWRLCTAATAPGPLPSNRPGVRRCSAAYSRTLTSRSKRPSARCRTSDFSTSD
jgi:hypothetical protein